MKDLKLKVLSLLMVTLCMTACNKDKELVDLSPVTMKQQLKETKTKIVTAATSRSDENSLDCFHFLYPIIVRYPDGDRERIRSNEEYEELMEELADSRDQEEFPTFQFPISVRLFDGESYRIYDEEELEELVAFCEDEFADIIDSNEEEYPTDSDESTSAGGERFGIFKAQDAHTVIMNGEIGTSITRDWDNLIAAYPAINKIIMKDCPGSSDDETNLRVARKVKKQGVAIHLPADASIASGAVDFFLAGTTRTRELGSKIGVHSWSDGTNEATDFPRGDENHQSYINYYIEMGFSKTAATTFYYFTIQAAKAEQIHWMTDAEINRYQLLTD